MIEAVLILGSLLDVYVVLNKQVNDKTKTVSIIVTIILFLLTLYLG